MRREEWWVIKPPHNWLTILVQLILTANHGETRPSLLHNSDASSYVHLVSILLDSGKVGHTKWIITLANQNSTQTLFFSLVWAISGILTNYIKRDSNSKSFKRRTTTALSSYTQFSTFLVMSVALTNIWSPSIISV